MGEVAKMPDRVFVSDKWDVALRGGQVSMCGFIKCDPFPHEYIRADLVPKWNRFEDVVPENRGYYDVAWIAETGTTGVALGEWYCSDGEYSFWIDDEREFAHVGLHITHWRERPKYPTEEV